MGKPIWELWARNLGITSTLCILPGALISIWYPSWPFLPYYALGVGLFVAIWEMPVPGLHRLGFVFSNLILRGFMYLGMSGALFLDAPTTTGALSLASTGIVYLIAGISGETFIHPKDFNDVVQRAKQQPTSKAVCDEPVEIDRFANIRDNRSSYRSFTEITRPESVYVK